MNIIRHIYNPLPKGLFKNSKSINLKGRKNSMRVRKELNINDLPLCALRIPWCSLRLKRLFKQPLQY